MSESQLSTERQAKISNDLTRVWKGKKVTDAFNADRIEDLFRTMEAFTDRGKCLDKNQLQMEGPLRVLEHPDHIHWEEEFRDNMAPAVVFGEQGFSLEQDDASDWQLSASKNGGFFIRKPTRALPLAVFKRHEFSDFRKYIFGSPDFSMIRNEVEKIVEKHIFGSPAKLPHQTEVVSRNRNLNSTPAYNPGKVHLWDDIMCDRKDPRCSRNFGNRRFALIVCMYMSKGYNLKENVTVRGRIARSSIRAVRNRDPGGRFLARTTRDTFMSENFHRRKLLTRGFALAKKLLRGTEALDDFMEAWSRAPHSRSQKIDALELAGELLQHRAQAEPGTVEPRGVSTVPKLFTFYSYLDSMARALRLDREKQQSYENEALQFKRILGEVYSHSDALQLFQEAKEFFAKMGDAIQVATIDLAMAETNVLMKKAALREVRSWM